MLREINSILKLFSCKIEKEKIKYVTYQVSPFQSSCFKDYAGRKLPKRLSRGSGTGQYSVRRV